MKQAIVFIFLLWQTSGVGQVTEPLHIIPAPFSVKEEKGLFIFSSSTTIIADDTNSNTKQFLVAWLKQNGLYNKETSVKGSVNTIHITSKGADQLPAEGYKLEVTPRFIKLTGKGAGLFYGIQTLIQLFPDTPRGTTVLPCLTIEDHPRYGYRGLMLDVSRHFFTVQQIKDLLNLMAAYKLNRFHWHLTDDQGWRLEIKSFPKLTTTGSWRVKRVGDFGGNMPPPQPGEPATDGGFYTQAQVKDIIQYAAARHIQVMPEIDVPGHSMAIVAAYSELSVTKDPGTRVNPGSSFAKWFPDGHFEMYEDNTLNPTDEHVFQFLDKVFTEVAALFPYEYIHVGGDECFKGYWEKDSSVKAFMQKNSIATVHALQGYFMKRLNQIIRSKHKKLIGWDEILDGGLNESVAVMNRFGEKRAAEQIQKHLPVIMAPGGHGLYFDYAQSASDMEPVNHGGNSPWWKAYNFDPDYPATLAASDRNYIMGVQGCIWTEHIPSVSKLQYMLLPRLLALAETGWAIQENKLEDRFVQHILPFHLKRFDAAGMNYRVPTVFKTIDSTVAGSSFLLNVRPPFQGARIFYTVNNRQPGEADHEYTSPVNIPVLPGKKIILKTIVLTPAGRRSVVTKTVIENADKK
jgi:hexosaminidase